MSSTTRGLERVWTAMEFLANDQHEFGDAWRYELVDGVIVAHVPPSPDRGAIISALTTAIDKRLESRSGCRTETGSGAAPRSQQRPTARIPDAIIRCGENPRVTFDVVSPSELRAWRARDRRRQHLQDIEGVREIVEIYQAEPAVHVYRRTPAQEWLFSQVNGSKADLRLESMDMTIPLSEIYRTVSIADGPRSDIP